MEKILEQENENVMIDTKARKDLASKYGHLIGNLLINFIMDIWKFYNYAFGWNGF